VIRRLRSTRTATASTIGRTASTSTASCSGSLVACQRSSSLPMPAVLLSAAWFAAAVSAPLPSMATPFRSPAAYRRPLSL